MSIQESKLQAIADAIRAKTHSAEPISANNFATEISNLNVTNIDVNGLLNGAIEEYINPPEVITLAPCRFYEFKNLEKADFTGVTEIPGYLCYYCEKLSEVVFDENTTKINNNAFTNTKIITTLPNNIIEVGAGAFQNTTAGCISFHPVNSCVLGSSCFESSGLTDISGEFASVGSNAMHASSINAVNIKVDGPVGSNAFCECRGFTEFNLNKESNITLLGSNAFSIFGDKRSNPESNIITLDFRNSSFLKIDSGCFKGYSSAYISRNKFMDIYFPSSVNEIASNAFSYSDSYKLYFNSVNPPTLSSSAFSYATNYKIFIHYNHVHAYREATNWSAQAEKIWGYSNEGEFAIGDTLPELNAEGHEVVWYDDENLTNVVTTVDDASKKYYCTVGADRVAVLIKGYENNAEIILTDGTETYKIGDVVRVGKSLIVTATATMEGYIPYMFTVSGATITEENETVKVITVGVDDIEIVTIYWDGANIPVDPVLENNNWQIIKGISQAGLASTIGWKVGDTKNIVIDGTNYTVRIADMQEGRYDYSNETRKTNIVFELVEIYESTHSMNTAGTNAGGWAESGMRTYLNEELIALLPAELQYVLEEVQIKSSSGYPDYHAITKSANKLFLLSYAEVFGNTSTPYVNEGSLYDYYQGATNATRLKYRNGSARFWWLRSPYTSAGSSNFNYVYSNGGSGFDGASNSNGVSFGFAF